MRSDPAKFFNKTTLALWVLCGLIVGSFFIAIASETGLLEKIKSLNKVSANRVTIIEKLNQEVLSNSDFSGPFFTLVERQDGTFSYAVIDKGSIENDRFV